MANIQIAVTNESTVVADSAVQAAVAALQQQVAQDFAPVWGISASLIFVAKGSPPPSGAWWLAVLDNSDQAGALGYHDLTPDGLPLGKVFAASDLQYGSNWTVTASHELLEMLGDPDINLCASVANADGSLRLYAYEVADACEADQYAYQINGVWVSDFVYPAWFESFRQPNSTQFDRQNHITAPFQLLPGGYIGILDTTSNSGWTQLTAQSTKSTYELRARVGSRRERRRTPRTHWLKSQPISRHRQALAQAGQLARPQFKTYRSPVYSLLQSALCQSINRRRLATARLASEHPAMQQFHAAVAARISGTKLSRSQILAAAAALPTAATAPVAPTSCAAMYAEMGWAEITGNITQRDKLANAIKDSDCDPLWAESVTAYLAWKVSGQKIPYVPYSSQSDFIFDLPQPKGADGRLVVGIIGDWGTGTPDASRLLGRVMAQNPDLLIHLGDIYYAGTVNEVADNFTKLLTDAGVNCPVYSLAGNHDMYSGGLGYYGLLQQLGQPASYFCLRNAAWQILGMDTGFNDHDVFSVNTNLTSLVPAEETWHLDKINTAGSRKTILLSHHQLFSPYGDGVGEDPVSNKGLVTNPNLLKGFNAVMGNIALWIWGHEHTLNVFPPYQGLVKGRCVGASAVPERDINAYNQNTSLDTAGAGFPNPPLLSNANGQPIQLPQDALGEFLHCFAILRLDSVGNNSVAEYYQIDSAGNALETLIYQEPL
jgi:hypothetical protein